MAIQTIEPDINPDIGPGHHDRDHGKSDDERATEIEQLEELHSRESAPEADFPTKGDTTEAKELGTRTGDEKGKGSGSLLNDDDQGFYKKDKHPAISKFRNSRSRRKWLLFGGGSIGLLFVGAVLLIMLLAPLKYVHFATVLRSVGFARFNVFMRERYSQIIFDNAVLDPASTGSFDRAGLGDRSLFQRLRFGNPEKQLVALGKADKLKFNFQAENSWPLRTTNTFQGVTVKTGTFSKTFDLSEYSQRIAGKPSFAELGRVERMSVKASFARDISVALSDNLSLEGRELLTTLKGMERGFGFRLTGFPSRLRDRFFADAKTAEIAAREDAYTQVEKGVNPIDSSSSQIDDAVKESREALEEDIKTGVRRDATEVVQEAAESTSKASSSAVASTARNVSLAVIASTGYCIFRDIVQSVNKIEKNNEVTSARNAQLVQSRSGQIMRGTPHVEPRMVQGVAKDFDGANASNLYKEDTGQAFDPHGADVATTPTLKIDSFDKLNDAFYIIDHTVFPFTIATDLLGKVPGLGGIIDSGVDNFKDMACDILLNPYVQGGIATAEVIVSIGTGGTETTLVQAFKNGLQQIVSREGAQAFAKAGTVFFGTVVAGDIVGSAMDSFIRKMSGLDFNGADRGASAYNQLKVGTNYIEQNGNRTSAYGAPMDATEADAADKIAQGELKEYFASRGWYDRYIAMDNPYSLAGSMVAQMPVEPAAAVADMGRSFINIVPKALGSLFSPGFLTGILGHKAYADGEGIMAQNNYFNVDQWGWTAEERARLNSDESFDFVPNTQYVEEHLDDFNAKYADCYTPDKASEVPDKCTADYLRTDKALHWRKYMVDAGFMTDLAETFEPTAAAPSGGSGSTTPSAGCQTAGSNNGFYFPLCVTKDVVLNDPGRWCTDCSDNKHHDYNAADIFVPTDTVVITAVGGKVISAKDSAQFPSNFGSRVTIKGNDGKVYFYTHMGKNTIIVKNGDTIGAGMPIGKVGTNADAGNTLRHLHFDMLPETYNERPTCADPPSAGTPSCKGFPFINVQPYLIPAFQGVPN